MTRTGLLNRRPTQPTTGDIPVRTDVFIRNLNPVTLEALRRAMEQGLTPSGLDFADDDVVILRFARTPEVEHEQRK